MSWSSNALFATNYKKDFKGLVDQRVQHWKELDNTPGDLDRRPDSVEISQGGVTLKAHLTAKKLAERTTLKNGDVTLLEIDRPGFFSAGSGREAIQYGNGQFFGVNFNPGELSGLFQQSRMSVEEARTNCMMIDTAHFFQSPATAKTAG